MFGDLVYTRDALLKEVAFIKPQTKTDVNCAKICAIVLSTLS
jgi:hypothetical protein